MMFPRVFLLLGMFLLGHSLWAQTQSVSILEQLEKSPLSARLIIENAHRTGAFTDRTQWASIYYPQLAYQINDNWSFTIYPRVRHRVTQSPSDPEVNVHDTVTDRLTFRLFQTALLTQEKHGVNFNHEVRINDFIDSGLINLTKQSTEFNYRGYLTRSLNENWSLTGRFRFFYYNMKDAPNISDADARRDQDLRATRRVYLTSQKWYSDYLLNARYAVSDKLAFATDLVYENSKGIEYLHWDAFYVIPSVNYTASKSLDLFMELEIPITNSLNKLNTISEENPLMLIPSASYTFNKHISAEFIARFPLVRTTLIEKRHNEIQGEVNLQLTAF